MLPSVGLTEFTLVTPASRPIRLSPAPRPAAAISSGSPAARTEPNASSRMTRAAATPTASAVPLGPWIASGTSPPTPIRAPACRSGAAAMVSSLVALL